MAHPNGSWLRFFLLSLALHSGFFFWVLRSKPWFIPSALVPIPVALLPLPEPPTEKPHAPKKSISRPVPKQAATRISQAPAIIAKRASPALDERPKASEKNPKPEAQKRDDALAHNEIQQKPVITERSLPTVRDLLPPLGWSAGRGSSQRSVPLNTSEPKYITYFGSVQRLIEANWQYPALALQYGLQGRVVIEFTILEDGRVEGITLVRSSGSALLDNEALRAIKAASPFPPIPSWIESKPLLVSAGMEYRDGRFRTWLDR